MRLQNYQRLKFNKYIKPLLIKDKCECCGQTEKLELHHNELFSELLVECLHNLGYEYYRDTKEYSEKELH